MMRYHGLCVLLVMATLIAAALAAPTQTGGNPYGLTKPGLYAVFETSMGEIICELYENLAPKTVANFVALAKGEKEFTDPHTGQRVKRPFYDGTIFHRVIDKFMIQGGDPTGTGRGGTGNPPFEDEFVPELRHDRPGRLSMANRGPNTNDSQFFITIVPTPWLDGRHTIFGQVVKGQDVVDAIGRVPTGARNKPLKDVVLKHVEIVRIPPPAAVETPSPATPEANRGNPD